MAKPRQPKAPPPAPASSVPQARKPPVGRPWQPGQSGNPSGLPKALREVVALAREHTPLAIGTLADIAADGDAPPAARVAASEALLDRAWGKAPQTVTVEGEATLTIDDVRKRLTDIVLRGVERASLPKAPAALPVGSADDEGRE